MAVRVRDCGIGMAFEEWLLRSVPIMRSGPQTILGYMSIPGGIRVVLPGRPDYWSTPDLVNCFSPTMVALRCGAER